MKAKNQKFTFKSAKELFVFKDDMEKIGRWVPSYDLEKLELTVSPFPEKYKKKSDEERKAKARREAKSFDEAEYDDLSAEYNR